LNTEVTNPVDRVSVYIAAGLVSGCGALMFNIMPVFVGALSDAFKLSESELGDIVAGFNIAFTIVAISSLVWVRRFNWRAMSFIGVAVAAISLLAMTLASGNPAILLLTACVGLGMGALYALIMAILGDSDDPDRAFGLKLGLETLPGAALLFLLPAVIVPKYGFSGVVLTMAATLVVLGLSSFWLPVSGIKKVSVNNESRTTVFGKSRLLSFLALFSSLSFFTGIAASWAFLELLANTRALPANVIGTTLAVGFIICGLGGFAAAAIADRWGRILPFAAIILINLLGLWELANFDGTIGYALGASLFLFSVNFALTYTFGLTSQVDQSGRLVVLSAAVLSIGGVVGPFISGRLVEAIGYGAMLAFSASSSLMALAVYIGVIHLHQKGQIGTAVS
jgi:predicted MFS family arabinose efflux permease